MKNKIKLYSTDDFIDYIANTLFDDEVEKEILDQIKDFNKEGKIVIDDNFLFGKKTTFEESDYLQIRCSDSEFICKYTKLGGKILISIRQTKLFDNNVKLNREEREEYTFEDDSYNEIEFNELEKIYNSENGVIYQSKSNYNHSYEIENNYKLYYESEDCESSKNTFELERKWYIPNSNTIIVYNIFKPYMCEHSKIEEHYFIKTKMPNGEYYSELLDEKLFKEFMMSYITIDKLKEKNKEIKEKVRTIKK